MNSGKLNSNSTQLNWIVQLSSVQFSAVHWTGDKLQRPATAVAGSWQSRTVASRHSSSEFGHFSWYWNWSGGTWSLW